MSDITLTFDLPEEVEAQIQKNWNEGLRLEIGSLQATQKLLLLRCQAYSMYRLQDAKMIQTLTERAECAENKNRELQTSIDALTTELEELKIPVKRRKHLDG